MKIRILSVGARAPDWVRTGFTNYVSRMPKNLGVELVEIPPSKHVQDPERYIADEGERILTKVKQDNWLIALDERGEQVTSKQLAQKFEKWQMQGQDVLIAIGGSDGLSADVKSRANEVLSLSKLTYPHHLVRVVIAEALYRAWTISTGHPYHRV